MKRLLLLLTFICFQAVALGQGTVGDDHEIGNPGDALRLLFSDAREAAIRYTILVKPEYLPSNLESDVRQFLIEKKFELAADIHAAPHTWVLEERGSCAMTNVPPRKNEIILSFPTCRKDVDKNGPVFLLIHESAHHFGFLDEAKADAIATAILAAATRAQQGDKPTWQGLPYTNAPRERAFHTATLIDSSIFIFGGCSHSRGSPFACESYFDDLVSFNLKTKQWERPDQNGDRPSARAFHSAVAIPDNNVASLFVWGGCQSPSSEQKACNREFNNGAVYNVKTKTWTAINAPSWFVPRVSATLHWTGREVFLWGGIQSFKNPSSAPVGLTQGAFWNPTTNAWRPASAAPEVLSKRFQPSATWSEVDKKLVVWGGCNREVIFECDTYFNSGAVFDTKENVWTVMSDSLAPAPRRFHSSTMMNQKFVVWGGEWFGQQLDSGAVYDFKTNSWEELPTPGPSARSQATAVDTPNGVLFWGGWSAANTVDYLRDSVFLKQNPDQSFYWQAVTSTLSPPSGRFGAPSVWTGDALFVWGGIGPQDIVLNIGALLRVYP